MYQIRINHKGNQRTCVEENTYEVIADGNNDVVLILGYLEDDPGVVEYGVVDLCDFRNLKHKHFNIDATAYPKFKNYR